MKQSKKKSGNGTLYRIQQWFYNKPWGIFLIALLWIAAVIGVGGICIMPSLWKFRSSLLFYYLFWTIPVILVGWYAWVHHRTSPLIEQIVASVPVLWMLVSYLVLSGRIRILLWTLLLYGIIGYWLYLVYLYQTTYESKLMGFIGVETVMFGGLYGLSAARYSLSNEPFPLILWLPALIFAIIATAVVVILLATKRLILRQDRKSEQIAVAILALAMTFVLTMFTAFHLNYALDLNDVENYSAHIVDKKHFFNVETGSDYYLILDLNGEEIEFAVSESDYRSHEIVDDFTVELHQGAFGVPYYIAGE